MKLNQKLNRNQKSVNQKKQNGLILLELVVSLGIFLSVMTIGMGALLTMYGVNKKSQTLKTVMNNLSFAVESMAREIVVGTNYHCGTSGNSNDPQDCSDDDGDTYITFCSSDDEQIFYRFNEEDKTIERYVEEDDGENTCGNVTPGNNDWQSITAPAPEVSIEKMDFYVEGTKVSEKKQPLVTLILEGVASPGTEEASDFNLQATLSQRAPKIPTN